MLGRERDTPPRDDDAGRRKIRAAVGNAREFRKRIPRSEVFDVATLCSFGPFVPARWKCWPTTKLRNSRECRERGGVRRSDVGVGGEGRNGVDEGGAGARCLDSVENMEGVRERVSWMDRRQSEAA